jgi:hypothetical protein
MADHIEYFTLRLTPLLSPRDVFECAGDKEMEESICHTQSLYQNQVLIVCMPQDQLFHTYGPKMLTGNQMSRIKYIYYINNVSKD